MGKEIERSSEDRKGEIGPSMPWERERSSAGRAGGWKGADKPSRRAAGSSAESFRGSAYARKVASFAGRGGRPPLRRSMAGWWLPPEEVRERPAVGPAAVEWLPEC